MANKTKVASSANIKLILATVLGWVTVLKNSILDATGKIKASIIPIGAGLKIQDNKVVFDSSNVQIDASKVNLPDASATVKGIVKVDGTTITADNGTITAKLPTKVSQLTNDSQFQTLTEVQSIANAAAAAAKDELIGGAPETYDTLKEIADYISDHGDAAAALASQIGTKADKSTVEALTTTVNGKADAATSLSGYGITDAKIADGVITLGAQSITPLTSDDVEAFTDDEIEAIIAEVLSEEAA